MLRLLLFLLFIIPLCASSQEGSPSGQKDFQLWLDAALNYKVNKKLDLKFEAAIRRENNLADMNENYVELQVRTDPFKNLVFSGGYRLSGWFDAFLVNRLFGFAKYTVNAERFRFQFRTRYDYNFSSDDFPLPQNWRNKIVLRYRTRKFPLDPYFGYEIFLRTNHWDRRVSQQRFDLGIRYAIAKDHGLRIYYRFQQQLNAVAAKRNFILGVSYAYNL